MACVWHATSCLDLRLSASVIAGPSWRDVAMQSSDFVTPGAKRSNEDFVSLFVGGAFETTLRWRLNRWLSVTAGYEALVVTDVQRADDAFDFTRASTGAVQITDNTDTLFVQTVALGLRFDF